MDPLLLAGAATGAALLGGLGVGALRRRRAARRWLSVLEETRRLRPGARTSAAGPELRADVDPYTVTLGVRDTPGRVGRGTARAWTRLTTEASRFAVGWDMALPPSFQSVDEVHVSSAGMDGTVQARADDPTLARAVAESAWLDVVDVRREAPESLGACLSCSGGYLSLELDGLSVSPYFLDRMVAATARIARAVDALSPSE